MACCGLCTELKGLYEEDGGLPSTAFLAFYDPAKNACGKVTLDNLFTSEDVYVETYFGRSANGTTSSAVRESTLTRTAPGQWSVVLTTPHPDGVNYHPSLTVEEQSANRDSVDIQVVQGTQTANGFDIMLTTGDNGGSEDTYVDAPWSFAVTAPTTVITGINTGTP